MEYLPLIGTVALIHFLAALSPGPDFLMTIRNTLQYSRRVGVWTGIGIGAGISVHLLYSFLGIALLISQSILLFNAVKILGAVYLIYIGVMSLKAKKSSIKVDVTASKKTMSSFKAFWVGFLTNVLNPKVTLFFLSLFTMVISPETPNTVMAVMGAMMVINTSIWFALVALFFSQKRVQSGFGKWHMMFEKIFGSLLIALGIKVALSER